QMELLAVGVKPWPECAAKHDALAIGQKHLRSAAGMARIGAEVALLIDKADIADAGTHIGKLPRPAARLVIGAGAELPGYGRGVLDTPQWPAFFGDEFMRRQCRLSNDLGDNLIFQ